MPLTVTKMKTDQQSKDQECFTKLFDAMKELKDSKPNNKSEADRRYAVTITDLEKVMAYFQVYIIESL